MNFMKPLKNFKQEPDSVVINALKKISFGLFSTGLLTGITLIMTGVSSKQNDFENVILFSLSTVFFLSLSIMFYYQISKTLLPEIRRRLNCDN